MARANKQAATIFRNYNETMKPICQHCGSHFDYLATELTDMLKEYEEAEQTMKRMFLVYFIIYMIFTKCTFIITHN